MHDLWNWMEMLLDRRCRFLLLFKVVCRDIFLVQKMYHSSKSVEKHCSKKKSSRIGLKIIFQGTCSIVAKHMFIVLFRLLCSVSVALRQNITTMLRCCTLELFWLLCMHLIFNIGIKALWEPDICRPFWC